MTTGDLWDMEGAVMKAYDEVENINDREVQRKAFEMVMHWRDLQVDLLKSIANVRDIELGSLAILDSNLTYKEELLARVAWANAEREMIELHRLAGE